LAPLESLGSSEGVISSSKFVFLNPREVGALLEGVKICLGLKQGDINFYFCKSSIFNAVEVVS